MTSKPLSRILCNTPSSISNPSGSATSVRRAICGANSRSICARQLSTGRPSLQAEQQQRHQIWAHLCLALDLLPPGMFLPLQLGKSVITYRWQADPLDSAAARRKGILTLIPLAGEPLPVQCQELCIEGLPMRL